ncbi:MAG: hypothetical protein ABII96_06830 [Candidatus Zixiibacteriota bacterium]
MITFKELKKELLKDKKFKQEYDRLKPEYDLIGQQIQKKLQKNTKVKLGSV